MKQTTTDPTKEFFPMPLAIVLAAAIFAAAYVLKPLPDAPDIHAGLALETDGPISFAPGYYRVGDSVADVNTVEGMMAHAESLGSVSVWGHDSNWGVEIIGCGTWVGRGASLMGALSDVVARAEAESGCEKP